MKDKVKRLGILGGGQLGRMSAQAASVLGIDTIIYTDVADGPASQVATKTYVGGYDDNALLAQFAQEVDVISYEFENIPLKTIDFLQTHKPVHPNAQLLGVSQHRVKEKTFLNDLGIKTAQWRAVSNMEDINKTLDMWGTSSCIVKTCQFGYDGKGQARVSKSDTLPEFGTPDLIAEEIINFDYEVSVIVARDANGTCEFYGPVRNTHKNHILDVTTAPAPDIDKPLTRNARAMVQKIAEALDVIGILTLELFVTKDGVLLANEIAPRTHNSGHYSMDACHVSQFENHVRAVCGMDVLPPAQHSHAQMINLIGDDIEHLDKFKDMENATIHLYGKDVAKPGRKMGHVNIIGDKL